MPSFNNNRHQRPAKGSADAAAYVKVQKVWVEAFANPKVPTTVFGAPEGGVGTDGDISRFIDLLTMQAAKGLAVDPSIARKSNE
ncbi:MAG: hypothetical protein ACPG6T_00465 [Paracoccaceae bacterium]